MSFEINLTPNMLRSGTELRAVCAVELSCWKYALLNLAPFHGLHGIYRSARRLLGQSAEVHRDFLGHPVLFSEEIL